MSEQQYFPEKREGSEFEVFPKSNVFISAKYQSTLLENKILSLALQKAVIRQDENTDYRTERPIAVIYANELPGYSPGSGSFYERIKMAAQSLGKRFILIEDREKRMFRYVNIIGSTVYEDGKLTIYFEPQVATRALMQPLKNFSMLSQKILQGFSNNYAFRLYENLKSHCFRSKYSTDDPGGPFVISYGVPEFKLLLGIVDPGMIEIQQAMQKGGTPDFASIIKKIEEEDQKKPAKLRRSSFHKFSELKRHVIVPSVNEINERTDIAVAFDAQTSGRGSKVNKLIFTVTLKNVKQRPSEDSQVMMMRQMQEYMTVPFTVKEMKQILEAADYNLNLIREKYQMMMASNAENKLAWLINAIRENYQSFMPAEAIVAEMTSEGDAQIDEVQVDEVEEIFERLWADYPKKRNKNSVSRKTREEIAKEGYERVRTAMQYYIDEVRRKQETTFPDLEFVNGGAFFRERYKEYLSGPAPAGRPGRRGVAQNFDPVDVDYDAIAKKKVQRRLMDDD